MHDSTTDTDAAGDGTGASDDFDGTELDGLAVEAAAERVRAREPDRDPETVRAALSFVAEDGVVSREALEESLKLTSKVLTTAETRAELATIALDDAREAAGSAPDLPTVDARLESFEAEVAAVEDRAAALGEDLQSVVDDREDPAARFAIADGLRRVDERAREVQRTADEIQFDLEEFERWLTSHAVRVRELGEDVDALATSLDDLATAVDAIEAAGDDAGAAADDPARVWFDATLSHRATGLTVADLRAELDDLRTWADREDADPVDEGGLDDLAGRLDDLAERREALGDRLGAVAEPEWSDRFGERVAAVESELADCEPPVDWGVVGSVLAEHRGDLESGA
ncbi:halo transducer protein [Halosimplex pelagicum]|uniref:Halo transducer protein n=1 Tax=Halosimplex pelagicum TaxID=869886 RepID=A0A7D5P6P6_9EURY|nr:halo transducer protein [Halosimplex pelagicum]QLH80501.1 halo transducer protein [Halosimplex pelagicum]